MQLQTQGRLWVGGRAAEDVPGTVGCRRWGDGPGWWCRGGGLGCGDEPWPALAWRGTGKWWSLQRWQVRQLLQWLRLWRLPSPETPCWLQCRGPHSWSLGASCLNPRLPRSAQRSLAAGLSPRPLTAHTASTTGEPPQREPQGKHLHPWLLPLLQCMPSPALHCPEEKQWQMGTDGKEEKNNEQQHVTLNCTLSHSTCSLHCTRALWISLGLRAWAWGRQLRASSAAALTMLGSLARDARSAKDATSGGVRWPSQHSTRMFRAALPISMAWPETRREDTVFVRKVIWKSLCFCQTVFLSHTQQSPSPVIQDTWEE